jgi:hypothetical protein
LTCLIARSNSPIRRRALFKASDFRLYFIWQFGEFAQHPTNESGVNELKRFRSKRFRLITKEE